MTPQQLAEMLDIAPEWAKAETGRSPSRMTPQEFRSHRTDLGLTQRQLAGLLDVTVETIKAWEAGRNPIRHLVVLAFDQVARQLAITRTGSSWK